MIHEFEDKVKLTNFRIRTKLRVPSRQDLPDIDVCLIDEARREIMICEFKWTIGAAEPAEIIEKREKEVHAIEQLQKLKQCFTMEPTKLSEVVGMDISSLQSQYYVGVFSNYVGSGIRNDDGVPVVDFRIFCKYLIEQTTLASVYREISNRNYLPQVGTDLHLMEHEIRFGRFGIVWTHFQLAN